jgi:hypothetical protein
MDRPLGRVAALKRAMRIATGVNQPHRRAPSKRGQPVRGGSWLRAKCPHLVSFSLHCGSDSLKGTVLTEIRVIHSWRIFWMTMLNRTTQHAKPTLAFTPLEIDLLNRIADEHGSSRSRGPPSLHSSLTQLACLGGYLNRASDPPPGNTVIWRGMSRLTDIEIGFLMGAQYVG